MGSQRVGHDLATTHTEETDGRAVTCHSQHLSESRSVVQTLCEPTDTKP